MMPNGIKDFPSLIRWIADTYHEGAVMHVGESCGISQATAAKWAHARAIPTLPKLIAFSDCYKLPLERVVELVKATKPPKLRGMLVGALVTLALLCAGAWSEARALPVANLTGASAPYRKRWFDQWLCVFPWHEVVMA